MRLNESEQAIETFNDSLREGKKRLTTSNNNNTNETQITP